MPSTMNISLPDSLKEFVDQQVREEGFAGTSDYVRDLIRRDRGETRLRTMLLEGAGSPAEGLFDDAYFESLRQRVRSDR